MHKHTVFLALAALVFVLATAGGAAATERSSSGSYSNARGSGTFEHSVEVLHGERRSTTTWKNTSGRKGEVRIKTTWDPERPKPAPAEEEAKDGSVTEEAAATPEPNGKAVEGEGKAAPKPNGKAVEGESKLTPKPNGKAVEAERKATAKVTPKAE